MTLKTQRRQSKTNSNFKTLEKIKSLKRPKHFSNNKINKDQIKREKLSLNDEVKVFI